MLKKTILLCLLAIATVGLAQKTKNNGYYGKRFFISGFSASQIPVFYHFNNNLGYVYKDGTLVKKNDYFNIGGRLGLGYSFKRNRSIIFQYGYDQFHIDSERSGYQTNYLKSTNKTAYLTIYSHEQLAVASNYFMLKMEFAPEASLLPMGLSHQVGIGISKSKIIDKNYHFIASYDTVSYYSNNPQMYDYDNSPFKNQIVNAKDFEPVTRLMFQYAINIRTPLSKSLFLSYGFEYNLSFKIGNATSIYSDNSSYNSYNYLRDEINSFQILSIIKFNFGLAFAF